MGKYMKGLGRADRLPPELNIGGHAGSVIEKFLFEQVRSVSA
jgi:hypothetical protein